MVAQGKGHRARPFTDPYAGEIVGQWQDWQKGIPPTREWKGRGAMDPRLLQAFAALDRAQHRAQKTLHDYWNKKK